MHLQLSTHDYKGLHNSNNEQMPIRGDAITSVQEWLQQIMQFEQQTYGNKGLKIYSFLETASRDYAIQIKDLCKKVIHLNKVGVG